MSDPDAALQRLIAEACLRADAGESMARDLAAFVQEHGVAPEDAAAILAAPPRLAVYRSLVRNGLAGVVSRMLPRTWARLDAACPGRLEADLAGFAGERASRTPYLRDVPAEFVDWAAPRWRLDPDVPAYLVDLARHELAHFATAAAAPSTRGAPAELALDRPLLLADSLHQARHDWAVHELDPDPAASDEPARRPVRLLAYRDQDHAVRWIELTPLAAEVVEHLAAGAPLGEAISRACAGHEVTPGAVLPPLARLLADLAERGVLLGGT